MTSSGQWHFNPHSREGSDGKRITDVAIKVISIHTPAKGVTRSLRCCSRRSTISIHTPAKGVTNLKGLDIVCVYISIHTPAKGVTDYAR